MVKYLLNGNTITTAMRKPMTIRRPIPLDASLILHSFWSTRLINRQVDVMLAILKSKTSRGTRRDPRKEICITAIIRIYLQKKTQLSPIENDIDFLYK